MNDTGSVAVVRWTVFLTVALLWLALGARFVGGVWIVAGRSMEPTLARGDWVVIDRWTYRHRPPRPGEVVLLLVPGSDATTALKRVVAQGPRDDSWEVRGDNPEWSLDSRTFGPLPADRILGRVALSFPLGRSGLDHAQASAAVALEVQGHEAETRPAHRLDDLTP